MNQGVYPLAASMINQINRLDQISNNLANTNTYGFKQEGTTETTFNYYLKRAQEQNEKGDIVYTRDGAFKNLDGFLVDSNGNNVLNQDNEPIVIEDGFVAQIGVTRTPYTNLDKIGNNTYMPKNQNELEVIENNDNMIVQGAVESSNVNSVSAMVELIDAHRRFDQSQRAMKSIDEINASVIDKIGGNSR